MEVGDTVPLTTDSENLDFYFDPLTKNLDYKVGNTDGGKKEKRALEVVDDVIKHVASRTKHLPVSCITHTKVDEKNWF